jgi:signal transduction histidine kinase
VERITQIVAAVKDYCYLDRAPVQRVDLHQGLERTLVILKRKFKPGVRTLREYAPNLPQIGGYGSELDQVWTKLISKAVEAMKGRGQLTLRMSASNGSATVAIGDTGEGLPPESQPRIFEPFFTTKPPGEGTGLGLPIAYNIVVHRHRGKIVFTSRPGETWFRVTLPIQLEQGEK